MSRHSEIRMDAKDALALKQAYAELEQPGVVARLTDVVGAPIEKARAVLPEGADRAISAAAQSAMKVGLGAALKTMKDAPGREASPWLHRIIAGLSGAVGGALGLPGLALDLPVSTIVMMRAIADVARAEGFDLADPEVAVRCLEVFALGGRTGDDDAADTSYYTTRAALARAVTDAARHLATKGASKEAAPALVRLIEAVAARFGVVVSEKVAAQLVPVIGAAAGAALNGVFTSHFQQMARGHFVVLRLERKYGAESVERSYSRLALPALEGGRR